MSNIRILRHSDNAEKRELFCLIGEYFASAEVRKEFGEPMTSNKQYTWFVAVDGDTVQGFATVRITYNVGELNYSWVNPEYRNRGVGTLLLEARLKYLESQGVHKIESVIISSRLETFEHLGFEKIKNIGQWIRVRKVIREKA